MIRRQAEGAGPVGSSPQLPSCRVQLMGWPGIARMQRGLTLDNLAGGARWEDRHLNVTVGEATPVSPPTQENQGIRITRTGARGTCTARGRMLRVRAPSLARQPVPWFRGADRAERATPGREGRGRTVNAVKIGTGGCGQSQKKTRPFSSLSLVIHRPPSTKLQQNCVVSATRRPRFMRASRTGGIRTPRSPQAA